MLHQLTITRCYHRQIDRSLMKFFQNTLVEFIDYHHIETSIHVITYFITYETHALLKT